MGVVMKPRSFLILVLIVLLGLWKGSYSLEEEEREEEKDLKEMLLGEMDAHHENNDVNKMGVKEHVEMLNNQYFGKQKLFHNKDHLDAHARKGFKNRLRDKRRAQYRAHKQHQTRIKNGEL